MQIKRFADFVKLTKRVLALLAGISFLSTICFLFDIDTFIFAMMGGSSIIPLYYLYKASKLFYLCIYHRMYILYICTIDFINLFDYTIGIPLDKTGVCTMYAVITGIIGCIILILKRKNV